MNKLIRLKKRKIIIINHLLIENLFYVLMRFELIYYYY